MSQSLPSSLSLAPSLLLCILTISSPHPQLESLITGYDWWPIRQVLIPFSVLQHNDYEYFYSSLEGMPVHCTDISSIQFTDTHIYTGVERGTKRIKCLGHNDPVQCLCWTAGSQVIALWLLFNTASIHPISSCGR